MNSSNIAAPSFRPIAIRSAGALLCIVLAFVAGSARGDSRESPLGEASAGRSRAETATVAGPVVVLGMDGLDWRVLLPMLKQGRLPHFAELIAKGSYGYLETFVPTFSPVIWTSIATGKSRSKHGIHHFVHLDEKKRPKLFDSTDRKTKAIWNIASDYGKSVNTVGWWMTYPVEEISGVMVAQTNTLNQLDTRAGKNVWKGTLLKGVEGQVHPTSRQNEMIAILERVDRALPGILRKVFGEFRHPLSVLGKRLWRNCRWAFRADATYLQIAMKLAEETPQADLNLLYFGGPDVVGHRFWRYMEPDLYRDKPSRHAIENFGGIIEDYYAYMDQALAWAIEAFGPEARLIVISDHGMHASGLQRAFNPSHPPARINSGDHEDAPPGVFVAAGSGIRAARPEMATEDLITSDLPTIGKVLDIAPTLLAMLGIPVGRDMEGRVLSRLFDETAHAAKATTYIATHDTPEFLARRRGKVSRNPGEEERLDQLRSLGYIVD